ncbi:MAG: PilW family protein [Candidatus Binatia bacterium]
MKNTKAGFSLIELFVTMVIVSLAMTAMVAAFAAQNRIYIEQDRRVALDEDLRMAMGIVTDTLRRANFGVPTSNLALWVNWVTNFNANPLVGDTNPDTLAIAACTSEPVATLAVDTLDPASNNVTTLTLDTAALLKSGNLVRIGDATEYARVTAVAQDTPTITIDTDPQASENQKIKRRYLTGTPICRVDVVTLSVDNDKVLWLDEHNGISAEPIAEGISDLQITTVTAGKQYQVTLTAETQMRDGSLYEQSLTSDVTLKN